MARVKAAIEESNHLVSVIKGSLPEYRITVETPTYQTYLGRVGKRAWSHLNAARGDQKRSATTDPQPFDRISHALT